MFPQWATYTGPGSIGWNVGICNNMNGLGRYYAWWNKLDRESQILYDITDTWNLKRQQTSEHNRREADSKIQRTS